MALVSRSGMFTSRDWLLAPSSSASTTDLGDIIQSDASMPEDAGAIRFTRLIMPAGVVLTRATTQLHLPQPGRVVVSPPNDISYNEETFSIYHLRRGRDDLHEQIFNDRIALGNGVDMVGYHPRVRLVHHFHCAEDFDFVSVSVPRSTLNTVIGEDVATILLSKLQLTARPTFRPAKVQPNVAQCMFDAFRVSQANSLWRLYMQTKAFEALVMFCSQHVGDGKATASDDTLAERIRDFLLSRVTNPPSAIELSQEFRLPIRTISNIFEKRYGCSMARHVLTLRLEYAYNAIKNTDIPLKVIADTVGYSHVNNFTNAFRKQFGYPPGSLRRQETDRGVQAMGHPVAGGSFGRARPDQPALPAPAKATVRRATQTVTPEELDALLNGPR